jgi:hypothetical protein
MSQFIKFDWIKNPQSFETFFKNIVCIYKHGMKKHVMMISHVPKHAENYLHVEKHVNPYDFSTVHTYIYGSLAERYPCKGVSILWQYISFM